MAMLRRWPRRVSVDCCIGGPLCTGRGSVARTTCVCLTEETPSRYAMRHPCPAEGQAQSGRVHQHIVPPVTD
eukprot:15745-Eustigmatos_ZCMA.PRE.1